MLILDMRGVGFEGVLHHTIAAFRSFCPGHAGGVRSARRPSPEHWELIVSTPPASTPQNALVDVERRIISAARGREATTEALSGAYGSPAPDRRTT